MAANSSLTNPPFMPYIFTSFCSVKLHENSTHSPFLSGLKLFPSTAVLSWEPTMYNDIRLKKVAWLKRPFFSPFMTSPKHCEMGTFRGHFFQTVLIRQNGYLPSTSWTDVQQRIDFVKFKQRVHQLVKHSLKLITQARNPPHHQLLFNSLINGELYIRPFWNGTKKVCLLDQLTEIWAFEKYLIPYH